MSSKAISPGAAWLGLIAALLLAGCDAGAKPEPRARATASVAPAGYAAELGKLDAAIQDSIALVAKRPGENLLRVEVAGLHQERARLTGDYEDYRRAQAVLDSSPTPSGPGASLCLPQAKLHFTLHRLKQAGAALDACPSSTDALEVAALRADIAMYSGRYREAEATYRALVNQVGTPQHFVRLAFLRNKTGSPAEAAALLEAAERRYHGVSATMKSWLKLQRGLVALDRGRLDEALALYRLASDALPGWWLVDEHIAEVLQLRGDIAGARQLYVSVVERTQAPEFMDALSEIEAAGGKKAEALQLQQRARALYEKRLADFPEAAAGHALDHYLGDAADAPRALALAEANFRTRPFGDSAVALAKAWMLSGKPERAAPLIEAQLALGWDTAEAHWVLSEALERSKKAARAAAARAEALHRNPLCAQMYASPA